MQNLLVKFVLLTFAVMLSIKCTKPTPLNTPLLPATRETVNNNLKPGISIAALRKIKVITDSIYTTLDYGTNGLWWFDSTDTYSKDNVGTVIVTEEGKRLKRVLAATDPIHAIWFGLLGNGSDETNILQAAIDASANRTLILPSGTFFSSKINLISNLTLTGNNSKLRNIQGANTDNIFINLWSLKNVEIANIEIALNGIRGDIWAGTSAIQIQHSTNIHIHHCFIHDNTYVGIRLTGGNTYIRINNNTIENTDTGVHANNENTQVAIISNIITKGTSEGITIYGYTEQNIPYDFHIDSNIIEGKKNSFGINLAYAKFGIIEHNTITNCLGGITLHDVVSVGKEEYYTSDMIIRDNIIANSDFGIINIGDRTYVSNNRLHNIQQDGINVNNYPDENIITTNVNISHNTITRPALAGGGRGGIAVRNLINSKIHQNTISQCGTSFSLQFTGTCENLVITQNNFSDGIVQSNKQAYNQSILITKNILSKSYFPIMYPLKNEFKMVASGNTYTTDTSYNTAPDNYGVYSEINTFNIRSVYSLAGGVIKTLVPSWKGRKIQLKSTNSFIISPGNNIKLKDSENAVVSKNATISLEYDGVNWKEVNRTF